MYISCSHACHRHAFGGGLGHFGQGSVLEGIATSVVTLIGFLVAFDKRQHVPTNEFENLPQDFMSLFDEDYSAFLKNQNAAPLD